MSDLTPMFRQYRKIKEAHRDCILMFRMGDFYEMFFEDAQKASRVLEITLTTRGKGSAMEAPMCGVPHHSAEGYIAKLVRQGYRVAICDQVEDARKAKGLVRREVIRVLSPGTVSSSDQLEGAVPNYLCSLLVEDSGIGAAFLDISTGDFRLAEHRGPGRWDQLRNQLAGFAPREILIPEGTVLGDRLPAQIRDRALVQERPTWCFSLVSALRAVSEHFGVVTLDGFGLEEFPLATRTAGMALQFLKDSQKSSLSHLGPPRFLRESDVLVLDPVTLRNLEITETQGGRSRKGSLLDLLDRTRTAAGARRLRDWLLRPLVDGKKIGARLDAVEELLGSGMNRSQIREMLRQTGDLERFLARASLGTASVRDVVSIRETLRRLPDLRDLTEKFLSARLQECRDLLDPLEDLHELLERAVHDDPSSGIGEGNVIRPGYSRELDKLRETRTSGKDYLARLEARERQRTGIHSLKIRHNKVFGYFLEVTKANLSRGPDDYTRKQTLANAERFILPDLKDYETKVLSAEEGIADLETEIFRELQQAICERSARIRATASGLADLDTLCCLAEVASLHRYCRPVIRADRRARIREGRHPVLEVVTGEMDFIPNDTDLDPDQSQILILTGPNMGGKSTYLRQVALLQLLAQIGSYVPATSAEVGLVDRIFSRIGASDNLLLGQSTFLREMIEVANILNNATDRSLILLDEVGRGTSTYDGLSLAWAVVEQLHETPRIAAKTLFATHYHELTELAETLPRVRNYTLAVRETADQILFLHKVIPGTSDRSYGIHVAKLAGVPEEVIGRAGELLRSLEGKAPEKDRGRLGNRLRLGADPRPRQLRLGLEPPEPDRLRAALAKIQPERVTPLEALKILADLKERAGE
ncbi:MAG: DNA mismatch repair protein MutS [Acidobacteriota bacterium]